MRESLDSLALAGFGVGLPCPAALGERLQDGRGVALQAQVRAEAAHRVVGVERVDSGMDHARARRAEKRGEGWERVTLTGVEARSDGLDAIDVLALHDALERFAAFDPRKARIVELRYFAGLTIDEAAEVMEMSAATVAREWTVAKAWLYADLSKSADDRPPSSEPSQ